MEKSSSANPRPPRTTPRKLSAGKLFGLLLAGTAVLVGVGAVVPTVRWANGTGYITTDLEAELRPSVEGAIEGWKVSNGQSVKKDQLLIQLKSSVEKAAFEQAQNELQASRAQMEHLLSSQALKVAQTKEQIYQTERKLAMARERYALMQAAHGGGFSPREVEEARLSVELFTSQLAELKLPDADVKKREVEVLQEQIHASEKAVALQEAQMKLREVRSPLEGTVFFNRFEPGEVVKPEHVLGQVFDTRCWIVKLKLPERAMKYVQVGQKVEIELAAYPSLRYGYAAATVSKILPVVSPQATGDGVFYVEAQLAPAPANVQYQPGMTVRAQIDTGRTNWLFRIFLD